VLQGKEEKNDGKKCLVLLADTLLLADTTKLKSDAKIIHRRINV